MRHDTAHRICRSARPPRTSSQDLNTVSSNIKPEHVNAYDSNNADDIDDDDLNEKTKEELISLVKRLKEQLHEAKRNSNSKKHRPHRTLHSPSHSLISETEETTAEGEQQFSEAVLDNNFEKRQNQRLHSTAKRFQLASPKDRIRSLTEPFSEDRKSQSLPSSPTPTTNKSFPVVGAYK